MKSWFDHKILNSSYLQRLLIVSMMLFCVLGFNRVFAQQSAVVQYSDSILNIARNAPTKESKIEGLLKVSIFWIDYDTVRAYQYLDEARKQMGKSPSDFENGLYHLYHANILMDFEPQKAKDEFSKADELLAKDTSRKSYSYRSKLWNNYGVVLQKEDKSVDFMEIVVNKTLPYARLAGDSAQVGYQLQNMAMLMSNLSNFKEAEVYYRQALQTLRYLPESAEDKLDIFINASKNAILINDFSQARNYLDSAKSYVIRLPHSTSVAPFHRAELTYFRHIGDKEKVLDNYQKGISAAKSLGDQYMIKDLNFEMSSYYKDLGQYQKAKEYLILSNVSQPYSRLQNRALFQHEMAQLENHLANYKVAYAYMDSLRVTMDSIYQKDVATKVLNFEQQYETAQKENRILRLETKSREQELTIARNRWWELALAFGLILVSCIAYFSWKIGNNHKKLLLQKERLHQEELHSVYQKEKLRQYGAMLQGQELERGRLAKDLHDGLGGLLAGVKLKLSSIVSKNKGGILKENSAVSNVIQHLDYSMDELRRIAHNMMPESLRFGGLVLALLDLCRRVDTPEMKVAFQDLGISDSYPESLRIAVYRIIQELLANAVKHAHADKIIMQCSEMNGWLFITVEDNGKGISPIKTVSDNGLGLMNIQNRIALLNGKIEIQSELGEGTTVNIQIPV